MNIAKVAESKPDREQAKTPLKRRTKQAMAKETTKETDKPRDAGASPRRVDVVA